MPVLYTSGYPDAGIVNHDSPDSAVAVLNKPYRKKDLAEKHSANAEAKLSMLLATVRELREAGEAATHDDDPWGSHACASRSGS